MFGQIISASYNHDYLHRSASVLAFFDCAAMLDWGDSYNYEPLQPSLGLVSHQCTHDQHSSYPYLRLERRIQF